MSYEELFGFSKSKLLKHFESFIRMIIEDVIYVVCMGLTRAKVHPSSELRSYSTLVNIIKYD